MSPAVVTLGVRYMTPVISVCIVARGFTSHPCSALAPGDDDDDDDDDEDEDENEVTVPYNAHLT